MSIDVPSHWYNILCDLQTKLPAELAPPAFGNRRVKPNIPKQLVRHNMPLQRLVPIPEELREVYATWRPSPLIRARRLERELGTPAEIYFKLEGQNLSGTHKLITAITQAHYYKQAKVKRLITCTAAGQWGTSMCLAAAKYGMPIKVYLVKASHQRKPFVRTLMRSVGAEVVLSPSDETEVGRAALAADRDAKGSLALAMSEAVEAAFNDADARWIVGGSEPYAILHSTVIGMEALEQMKGVGAWPDVVIAYMGGGKNFGGLSFPFLAGDLHGETVPRCVAVESAVYPALTRGRYLYDVTDFSGTTPVAKQYTLGSAFKTRPLRAEGIRYHAASKLVSALYAEHRISAKAYQEAEAFEAALLFGRTEGVIPSPEAAHAVKAAIDEANEARTEGRKRTILFCLSDLGNVDMGAYDEYAAGQVAHVAIGDDEILASINKLPSYAFV